MLIHNNKSLVQRKHDIIRQLDVTNCENKSQLELELTRVNQEIDKNSKELINNQTSQTSVLDVPDVKPSIKIKKEVIQMAEEKTKVKKESKCGAVINALQKKSIKNVEGVVEKVKETFPDANEKKLKLQIKSIIYNIKKQHGRWAKYDWNEETFLATVKE